MARTYGLAPPGFRLPDDLRLGPVVLQVANLERSTEFYSRVLGLRVVPLDGGAQLSADGSEEPLVELRVRRDARRVPPGGRLGLFHFAILLPDRGSLGQFIVHLSNANVRAGSADHWVSEAVYLQDPDNLGIEVYADRPRGEWTTMGDEVAMATEPLDFDSLVRAAGDKQWAGMPANAVIGHVHLHVGSLQAAEAFYHAALGFDKTVWSYPGALFLSAGGYHHHLGTNIWASGALPAGENDARLLEWRAVLPGAGDVLAAAESVRTAGYAVATDGEDRVVADPWGTTVRLTT